MTPEIHFSPVSKTEDNNRTLFVQIGDLNIPVNNETGETISVGDVVEVWITDAGRNAIRLAGNTTNTDIGVVKEIVDTGEAVVESNGRMKLVDEAEPVNIEEGQTVELLNGVVNQIISDEAIEPSYRRDTETDPAERAEEYLVDPTDNDVTYDDVGGLSRTIEEVKEVVEVPLEENQRETNRFEAHGIEPDSGIVFHGPPGTGKTLLARAVANEVGSSFYLINGPEIINKWYGETEDIIRDIFDHAEEQESAVIFMDEIDSIAPKRSDTRQFQRKIVAQLLTAMDGFDPHSNIVVIGATNELDEVDPALLRSGRLIER